MLRPCYLVVDREFSVGISTRKLVIETAKFNVITAYSSVEAIEALRKFPNVDGIVMDAGMKDLSCTDLIAQLQVMRNDVPIVVVGDLSRHPCSGATHHVQSFNPKQILALLQQLHPEETSAIDQRNQELEKQELQSASS